MEKGAKVTKGVKVEKGTEVIQSNKGTIIANGTKTKASDAKHSLRSPAKPKESDKGKKRRAINLSDKAWKKVRIDALKAEMTVSEYVEKVRTEKS